MPNADPGKMDDDDDIGSSEKDMCGPEMGCDQENVTAPKKPPSDTLKALGADKPYKQPSY
jgi:hypothetical protein